MSTGTLLFEYQQDIIACRSVVVGQSTQGYNTTKVGMISLPRTEIKPEAKCLSLLEFKTWQLRPLGRHGR